MSQLIQMRQRIKAIETIKKITSAMRLISRSLHTRMNKEKEHLIEHKETITTLFTRLCAEYPQWNSPVFFPPTEDNGNPQNLFIIIGAQKGLCGTYNSHLLYWIKKNNDLLQSPLNHFLGVGKKMYDQLLPYEFKKLDHTQELKISSIESLTQELVGRIINAQQPYSKVIVISNYAQSFFTHKHKETSIIPLKKQKNIDEENSSEYLWQNNAQDILDTAARLYLQSILRTLLFEALAGEQAARFIAMDNATRNADNFLDIMQLQYNKLRQAKITKELTELTTNL